MQQLNPRQKEAVRYTDGPLLVLAGAGSGKTKVITEKIAHLIKDVGYASHHIAAVTFTNKAAREMKERVGRVVPKGDSRGLIVSTFHNLGLNMLRKEHQALGLKAGFTLFDAADSKKLLQELMLKDFADSEDDVKALQSRISLWKNDMLSPGMAISTAEDDQALTAARLYERYQKALKAYNAVDFDDLIQMPVLLLREQPDALLRWQKRIRYLLVDEYQDTNVCQYELVRLLVKDRQRFTVVGDDDQSIYAWRGARPENLARLQDDFTNLKVVKLEQNYRSRARILESANHLIANNPHVFEKALWSDKGLGDEIRLIRARNEELEVERIATEILDQQLQHRAQFRDFAVLYRTNYQARLLEMRLQHYQIPYRISGGTSFFSRNEIKDAMAYLRLIINPDDDAAFLRIINTPRREIGTATLEKLGSYASERGVSLYHASQEFGLAQQLNERQLKALRSFIEWFDGRVRACYEGDAIAEIRQLFIDIDYADWLQQDSATPVQAERRLENVYYLIDSLQKSLEGHEDEDNVTSIEDAIRKLVLRDLLEQQEEADDLDRVQLMTLHSSKGLEFPHVFIMGLEEGLLPSRNSIDNGTIEEERRLMYVGITRAQETLTLLYAGHRKQQGEKLETSPSRFIEELPQQHLVTEGIGPADPERSRQKGQQTLANLKSMLD